MMTTFPSLLQRLGSVDALWAKARALSALPAPRPHNAHIHLPPNFSAFTTTDQALRLAGEQGLVALGGSNYYDYTVYHDLAHRAAANRVFPLFGLEILSMDAALRDSNLKVNDPGNPGRVYLCGKGISPEATYRDGAMAKPAYQHARGMLEHIRTHDANRLARMVELAEQHFLAHDLPTELTYSTIARTVAARHGCDVATVFLQERHVAQAFQEALFVKVPPQMRPQVLAKLLNLPQPPAAQDITPVKVQNDLRAGLLKNGKPAFVPEPFVTLEEARQLVLDLDGIPSYPTLADGASPICPFEENLAQCIAQLRARRIHAAELIPVRNSAAVLEKYVTGFREAGLVVTAGTEHNSLDLIPLAPTCKGGVPIPPRVQEIFWEGMLVILAHQVLTAAGQVGYVNHAGELNPAYPDQSTRLATLARFGAAALEQYLHSF